jgi:nitroreductase
LATCWVAAFKVSDVKSILNLPPGMEPLALTPLGYSLDYPEPTHRKTLEEIVQII